MESVRVVFFSIQHRSAAFCHSCLSRTHQPTVSRTMSYSESSLCLDVLWAFDCDYTACTNLTWRCMIKFSCSCVQPTKGEGILCCSLSLALSRSPYVCSPLLIWLLFVGSRKETRGWVSFEYIASYTIQCVIDPLDQKREEEEEEKKKMSSEKMNIVSLMRTSSPRHQLRERKRERERAGEGEGDGRID